nr:fibronectin type III domain-containing protein [Salinibacter ruber]
MSADSEAGASVLQWSEPEAEDLEGYNVHRSPDTPVDVENSTPLTDGLVTGPPFTDESAENGTTYRYRVTAVDDSDNESAPSDSARVTPSADPPPRPSSQP